MLKCFIIASLLFTSTLAFSNTTVYIGVASSFKPAANALIAEFAAINPVQIKLSSASSGKLVSQAINGAPFDILLFADSKHSLHFTKKGASHQNNAFVYAKGTLQLLSHGNTCLTANTYDITNSSIAIANPKLAPYGIAASQAIDHYKLGKQNKLTVITAENAGQTMQFFDTKNVDHVMTSSVLIQQWLANNKNATALLCPLSANSYGVIIHQGVRLNKSNAAAQAFVDFLLSPQGQTIIATLGYEQAP